MATKKPLKKAKSKAPKTSTSSNGQTKFEFKDIKEGMTKTEQREVHQFNLMELFRFQTLLEGTTRLDDSDSVIAKNLNRIVLIDRKIMRIGSEINKLTALIEEESKTSNEEKKPEMTM